PGVERSFDLPIGEHPVLLILRVFCDPPHPERPHTDTEHHPGPRSDRIAPLHELDSFPGRSESLERARTFMKREDDRRRCGDPRLLLESHSIRLPGRPSFEPRSLETFVVLDDGLPNAVRRP